MKIYLLIVTSFLLFTINSEPEWKKRKEKSGIVVYTRSIENAPMDEFKGIITVSNTTLMEVLDVIMDIENYPKWIPDCMKAETLHKDGKYHSLHYVAVN